MRKIFHAFPLICVQYGDYLEENIIVGQKNDLEENKMCIYYIFFVECLLQKSCLHIVYAVCHVCADS